MNEYRCTRPDCYQGNCPGNQDKTARQGYYVNAEDEAGAHRSMRETFPKDSHFTVDFVKPTFVLPTTQEATK